MSIKNIEYSGFLLGDVIVGKEVVIKINKNAGRPKYETKTFYVLLEIPAEFHIFFPSENSKRKIYVVISPENGDIHNMSVYLNGVVEFLLPSSGNY